jgi:hypothetical protein
MQHARLFLRLAGFTGPLMLAIASAQADTLVSWCGQDWMEECDVEFGGDFIAVDGGFDHGLALKADGSLFAWGSCSCGECDVPAGNDFVAIAAGFLHSLFLKADGSIVVWGSNYSGECIVPAPNTDFVAIAEGGAHSLGIRDGCPNDGDDTDRPCGACARFTFLDEVRL